MGQPAGAIMETGHLASTYAGGTGQATAGSGQLADYYAAHGSASFEHEGGAAAAAAAAAAAYTQTFPLHHRCATDRAWLARADAGWTRANMDRSRVPARGLTGALQ